MDVGDIRTIRIYVQSTRLWNDNEIHVLHWYRAKQDLVTHHERHPPKWCLAASFLRAGVAP